MYDLLSLFLIAQRVYIVPLDQHIIHSEQGANHYLYALILVVVFYPFSYLFACLLAGRWIRPKMRSLIFYMGMTMLCACTLEIFFDSIFVYFIDRPAWLYHVWPLHNGYTSGATFLVWPWYGSHIYFFHLALKSRKTTANLPLLFAAILFAIDALFLETLVNLFSLTFYKSYYFYYLQSDLFHFTSLEIFIPYVICGIIITMLVKVLDYAKFPALAVGIVAYILGNVILFS